MHSSKNSKRLRGAEYKARTDKLFQEADNLNRGFLRLFGSNNRVLRGLTGKSCRIQCNELLEHFGFYTKEETLRLLELNRRYSFRLRYLQCISLYWGLPLLDLLTIDYSLVENQGRLPIKFAEKLDKRIGREKKLTDKMLKEEKKRKESEGL